MNATAIVINLIALAGILIAFVKDRKKTVQSLKIAGKSFIRITPTVLTIIVFIGLLLGFVPPEQISRFVGEQSGISGVLLVSIAGAVMHVPSLISFPLAASLLKSGASITAVAAFITTLTMVGTITLPLEIRELGRKIALLRNGMSFVFAIVIALIMGALL
jgi:uncharacterized membrane protein YraQ (UPF0718 family)